MHNNILIYGIQKVLTNRTINHILSANIKCIFLNAFAISKNKTKKYRQQPNKHAIILSRTTENGKLFILKGKGRKHCAATIYRKQYRV